MSPDAPQMSATLDASLRVRVCYKVYEGTLIGAALVLKITAITPVTSMTSPNMTSFPSL